MPAFDHESLCSIFNKSPQIQWHIFSPTCEKEYHKQNVWVRPVGKDTYLDSFENSLGIVSSTGFETTSEALYLGKKLLTKKLLKMGFPKSAFIYWVFKEKIWSSGFLRI